MMHTAARADRKELLAKNALAEAGRKGGMANTVRDCAFL